MSASGSGRGWWLVVLILLFFLFTGLFWPFVDDEKPPETQQPASEAPASLKDSVTVVSWDWRDDRTGSLFAVWGIVRNESSRDIDEVILELRTVDADSNVIARYGIRARNVPAGQEKPFRGDVPRTGREVRGFLEVNAVVP